MKKKVYFLAALSFLLFAEISVSAQIKTSQLIGAWSSGGDTLTTIIFTEKYFAETIYSIGQKNFISTSGGSWVTEGNKLIKTIEFHSSMPVLTGEVIKNVLINVRHKDTLVTTSNGVIRGNREWIRVDNGKPGALSGAWLITGRMQNGELESITPGARRTMKILSGTRFQWIAYNTETKEFLGTGGGTYTAEDGKYIESIEFFSRDNNRVGAVLEFDFELNDGEWRHKGMSSKGEPIDEVWTKREKVQL
jgi:hypothetical protein